MDCDALDADDCAPSRGVKVNMMLHCFQRLLSAIRLTERVRDQNTSNRVEKQVHAQKVISQMTSQLSQVFSIHKGDRAQKPQ